MDVLPGRSVHEWMHTTKMPWSVIWAMVDQVLAGLAPRARARRDPRRPEAVATSCSISRPRARPACVRPRPRARVAPRSRGTTPASTARPRPSPRCTRGPGRWAGWRQSRSVSARPLVGPADGPLCARLHHLSHPHGQRGVRGQRAGRAPRPQAHAGSPARAAGGGSARGRRSTSCDCSRRSPGTASSSRRTRGGRG